MTTQPDHARFHLITAIIGVREAVAEIAKRLAKQLVDPLEPCDECKVEFNPSTLDLLEVKREAMLPARHSAQIEPEYQTYYEDLYLCENCIVEVAKGES